MAGLAKICKLYGSMTVKSGNKSIKYIYDYYLDKPRKASEMSKKDRELSEKVKNGLIKPFKYDE